MTAPLLDIDRVSAGYGAVQALDEVSLYVQPSLYCGVRRLSATAWKAEGGGYCRSQVGSSEGDERQCS